MAGSQVIYHNNTAVVRSEMRDAVRAALHEAGGEIQAQAMRNSRVATGQTKRSYQYQVDAQTDVCVLSVGSSYENAIWEEYGTGEYALEGNGRRGGWVYKDASGYHHTTGKRGTRALWKAFQTKADVVRSRIQSMLGGL